MGRSKVTALVASVASVAFALTALAPHVARAQSAQDKAAAESAYQEGKKLMIAHAYADACPKLAESQHLDPGIGTMLGLADCYEKNGQTASAWAEFKEAAALAARANDKREALARQNATRLEPLLSRLVVHVPPEANPNGLALKRDGVDLARAEWEAAVPVDPGVHTVAASAPGRKDWQSTVTVPSQPGAVTMNVPTLAMAPARPADGANPAAVPPFLPPPPPPATDETPPGRTQRIAAVVTGGVGVVAVVIGSVFGLEAKGKLDDSNANGHCDASDTCDGTGLGLRSDAKSAALVSTIGFVVGGAAIAGGAVLWFTAPHGAARGGVGLAPGPGGVSVVGAW